VRTSTYNTVHQIPEQHVRTSTYNTYTQVPEHHVRTSTYNTVQQIPEQHVRTSTYNTVHQVPETHVATHSYKVAHTTQIPYTVTSTAYKSQSYKVPYTTTHTKTVEVPYAKSGYRRLAGDAASAAKKDAITNDDATTALASTLKGLPYGAKVVSTHTVEIPQYHTKTITHTAYKTVAKPYTVVSHVVCTPKVQISYQCGSCTGSTSYVPSYGADFLGARYTGASLGYTTHVFHHIYHPAGVIASSYNAEGPLSWTPTKNGWKADGHKDWRSASLNEAAVSETKNTSKSSAGTIIGASIGSMVGMALVAGAVYKRRQQPVAVEDNMSIL